MSNGQDFEEKERERKIRRKIFYLTLATLTLISGGFLIWKLSILILPIIVGCLLAFVFRPVKDRFRVLVASRGSSPLFLRSDWRSPVFRFQYAAQTHPGRAAETRVQGPPTVQTECKVPATGRKVARKKIKRGDAVDRKRSRPADG